MSDDAGFAVAPLQIADLDRETLAELFDDVDALGEGLEIVVNKRSERAGGRRTSLDGAMELLTRRLVDGVQLRYRHGGVEWWDTVMPTPDGYRLVRMQRPGDDP